MFALYKNASYLIEMSPSNVTGRRWEENMKFKFPPTFLLHINNKCKIFIWNEMKILNYTTYLYYITYKNK